MMRKVIVALSILIIGGFVRVVYGQEDSIFKNIGDAEVALMIYDLDSSRTVIESNADVKMTPASVMKIFTTATAMQTFGPERRIHTVVSTDGNIDSTGVLHGNLYVRGALDPTIESSAIVNDGFFAPLIDTLVRYGITKIEGDIVADGTILKDEAISRKWVYEDIATYYGVGCYGLSAFDNVQRFTIKSGGIAQKPTFSVDYPETGLNIIDRLSVVSGKGANVNIYTMPYSRDVLLEGQIGTNVTKTEPLALTNPVEFVALHIKSLLAKRNIPVVGNVREAQSIGTTVLFVYRSPMMFNIIKEINYHSNNHFAQHLFKLLGSSFKMSLTDDSASVDSLFLSTPFRGTSTIKAVDEVKRYWRGKQDVNLSAITMYDGNGLSPMDAASARMIVSLLSYMWNSENAYYFFMSLPVCGSEGTVRSIFTSNCFYVRAKSGSMSGVQSYAGYINSKCHSYAFCVMVNEFDCNRSHLRSYIEDAITNTIQHYETTL